MSTDPIVTTTGGARRSELGALLAGAVQAVADAQDVLDQHAQARASAYVEAEPGQIALPPLWYAFDEVGLDLSLSTEVVRAGAAADPQTRLLCRTVNPVTAGVYGYAAATGTRIRLTLSPQRIVPTPVPDPKGVDPS